MKGSDPLSRYAIALNSEIEGRTNMPNKYRKKPVVIDALHVNFGKTEVQTIVDFVGEKNLKDAQTKEPKIITLEGEMLISDGDYIIKGIQGEFYPCKPDIFEVTYEKTGKSDFLCILTRMLSVFPDEIDKSEGSVLYDLFAPFALVAVNKPPMSPTINLNNAIAVKEVSIEKIAHEIAKRMEEELSKTTINLN